MIFLLPVDGIILSGTAMVTVLNGVIPACKTWPFDS